MKSLKPKEVKDMLGASPDLSAGLCDWASGLELLSASESPGKPRPVRLGWLVVIRYTKRLLVQFLVRANALLQV